MAAYATYLFYKGVQSSTMKSYISAIKKILELDDYQWSDDKLNLTILIKACKMVNDTVKTRLPIRNGLLELILFENERYFTLLNQPYLEVLYRAIFLVLYYGLLRIGEVTTGNHPILAKDIYYSDTEKKLMFVLHSSKTHGKESNPQKVKIQGNVNLQFKTNRNYYCPYLGYTRISSNQRGL